MNIDWLEGEIMNGMEEIMSVHDFMRRKELANNLYEKIRFRLTVEINDALTRIRNGCNSAIETEREIVP